MTLGEIAARAGACLRGGDAATRVTGVATLQHAQPGQISFLINPRYRQYLRTTQASAVILSHQEADACTVPVLIAVNPHVTYARVAALFEPRSIRPQGIHSSAVVNPAAQVAETAWIGPHCTVEAGAIIESHVFVGPNCVIGERARLGADTCLVARVCICHSVQLGQRVLIHPGAVIGSDGFGFANDNGHWLKVPQLGSVQLGDDVEIGANTTIDRGALEDTVIETGVKLDNQIQVGHNVYIGAHTIIAGCVGIAGSTRIGRHCAVGGGVGISGHLEIVDQVQITAGSGVANSITQPGVYSSGLTVEPNRLWNKINARLRQLDDLARRLIALEKKQQSNR